MRLASFNETQLEISVINLFTSSFKNIYWVISVYQHRFNCWKYIREQNKCLLFITLLQTILTMAWHFICSLSFESAIWAWELCSTEGFICWFHLLAGYSGSCHQQVTALKADWSKGDSWNSLSLLHMVSLSTRLAWLLPMASMDSEQAATQAKLEKANIF